MSVRPDVSIVVPTRDRPDALAACLTALQAQTAARFEILVVDDASRDAAGVAGIVARTPLARLVRAGGGGPAAARNTGAALARGPVLCFTDDDCQPVPQWAAALAARLGPEVAAAAGPTRVADGADTVATAAQVIASHLAEATMDAVTGRMRFAPTSNLACRSDVWRRLPFDEGYPLAAGEDRDWCARLQQAGDTLVFEPAAVVRHHPQLTLRAYWRQQLRYGRGAYRFHRDHGTLRRPAPPAFYAALVRRALRDGGVPTAALVCLAQVATAAGMAHERWRATSGRRDARRRASTR